MRAARRARHVEAAFDFAVVVVGGLHAGQTDGDETFEALACHEVTSFVEPGEAFQYQVRAAAVVGAEKFETDMGIHVLDVAEVVGIVDGDFHGAVEFGVDDAAPVTATVGFVEGDHPVLVGEGAGVVDIVRVVGSFVFAVAFAGFEFEHPVTEAEIGGDVLGFLTVVVDICLEQQHQLIGVADTGGHRGVGVGQGFIALAAAQFAPQGLTFLQTEVYLGVGRPAE